MTRVPGGTYGILAAGQSIYDAAKTPSCAVGSRLPMGDRVFFYGKVNTTVARGDLLSSDVSHGGPWSVAVDGAGIAITAANRQLGDTSRAITANLAIGDNGIGVFHTSYLDNIVAHQLTDGYIFLNDTGTVQQVYKIRDNTAHGAVTTDVVEILIYDEIRAVTVDATCSVSVMQNQYMGLKGAVAATDEGIAGVAMAVGTTTYPYIWIQTWGPGIVSTTAGADGTSHAGTNIVLGTVAGAADIEGSGDILPVIGFGLCDLASAGDGLPIDLRIRP